MLGCWGFGACLVLIFGVDETLVADFDESSEPTILVTSWFRKLQPTLLLCECFCNLSENSVNDSINDASNFALPFVLLRIIKYQLLVL